MAGLVLAIGARPRAPIRGADSNRLRRELSTPGEQDAERVDLARNSSVGFVSHKRHFRK